jgi:RNA polymerase sigma-70 factor, ECF subfamily
MRLTGGQKANIRRYVMTLHRIPEISDDERELVRRLRERDEDAFATMIHQYAPGLLRVARRFFSNEQDARDVVQQAFVSVTKAIAGFEHQSKLSTWLYRIVVNEALLELRKRRRRPEVSIEELLPGFDLNGRLEADPVGSIADELQLERRETREFVRNCIAMLPESYRVAVLLRDIEDLTVSEAAEAIGVTPNALKVRLHRGRQALRGIVQRELRAANGVAHVNAAARLALQHA